MSNEIKNTINDPFNPLPDPLEGQIVTSSNTGGLLNGNITKAVKLPYYTVNSQSLSQSLYKDTPEYKTPAWKIGTQVTYWDKVEKQFILGIIQGAYLRDKEWIYNINGVKVQENHIEEFIETDQQGLIKKL